MAYFIGYCNINYTYFIDFSLELCLMGISIEFYSVDIISPSLNIW